MFFGSGRAQFYQTGRVAIFAVLCRSIVLALFLLALCLSKPPPAFIVLWQSTCVRCVCVCKISACSCHVFLSMTGLHKAGIRIGYGVYIYVKIIIFVLFSFRPVVSQCNRFEFSICPVCAGCTPVRMTSLSGRYI